MTSNERARGDVNSAGVTSVDEGMSMPVGPDRASDRTADLIARDAAHVWHPFTQQSLWLADRPIVVDRAAGMHFWDTDGNRYLDGVSSLWVNVHGHCHPRINEAIKAQVDQLDHTTFLGLTHRPGIELAEKLVDVAPGGLDRVFYAGDGSSAVEAALKMAYQFHAQTGGVRPLIVHVAQGYHGDTLGAVSVGGIELFHDTYRAIMLRTRMIGSPGVLEAGQGRPERASEVVAELDALLDSEGDQVCAVVVEPMVQGAGGMLTHDGSFLRGVRAACDRSGALMIADEVATGIGRTGRMWAVEHAAVVPDLLTAGKGLTAGYLPLSAVLTTSAVYDAFLGAPARARTFFHGHSYTANPLAAAAANANLDLMAQEDVVARAAAAGERLGRNLAEVARIPGVREVRRMGTMVGIQVEPRQERTGFAICQQARRHGVWIRPLGDVVVLMPPLTMPDDDLDLLAGVTASAVQKVLA